MNTRTRAALALLITVSSVALILPATPVYAQSSAQREASVSLPDPNTPGPPAVQGGQIAVTGAQTGSPIHGTNVRAAGGPNTGTQAELSMSVSGSSIVITFNGGPNGGGYVTSTNGGVTFGAMTSPPRPAGAVPCCDTGVASDLIGRFYYLELYRNDGAANCTNSVHLSTNGGQTFGNIVGSPFSYGPGSDFPDQPHIALDRVNFVAGNPQLYVTTRHFTSGINCPQTGGSGTVQGEITCSTNGGVTWAAPIVFAPFSDTQHMATGSDGSLYVVGNGAGTQANTGNIMLRRSTNDCLAGLAFGAPATVADNLTYGGVGIDREFPQPYVAVDKLDPNTAYVGWSSDRLTGDNDRDIFLARCTFAGTAGTCDAPVRVNDDQIGSGNDQYFPMLCVDPNNRITLSWNDQRAGANSTAIFHTEVDTTGAALSVGPSFVVSDVNFTPFNFGGTPDYGDYNENVDACDGQHLYAAWVSHVSPAGIAGGASNDPDIFFSVVNHVRDIRVQGPLDFGDVCSGDSPTRALKVFNVGDATLTVTSVARISGSTDITVDANPTTPLTISPDAHVDFTIRCSPSSFGLKTATIRVTSDDPDQPQIDLTATCNAPAPDIRVTGSTAFGDLCAGSSAEQQVSVCNTGACNLNVASAAFVPACPDFQLVNNPFPATVSPDSCLGLTIRFTPTSPGPKSCNLQINSNDPGSPVINLTVTANTPAASIDVPFPLGQSFLPEVIQNVGMCQTLQPFPISNTGACPLTITNIAIGGTNAGDFGLSGLPSFPIVLEAGHIAGEGDLQTIFKPIVVDRDRLGTLTVTWVSDPVTGATTDTTRNLCGEGVLTGTRVLVTNAEGVPYDSVESITLHRINANRNKNVVDTVDVARNLAPVVVTPAAPCSPFTYHREYGTVSNPIQLLPGSYTVTATVRSFSTGKVTKKTVALDVQTCDFNPTVVIVIP